VGECLGMLTHNFYYFSHISIRSPGSIPGLDGLDTIKQKMGNRIGQGLNLAGVSHISGLC